MNFDISKKRYGEVVVDVQNRAVDRLFHYSIPPDLQSSLKPGHRVIVPFGSMTVVGYVIRLVDWTPVDEVKPILRILDEEPLLTKELLDLALWLAKTTYSRLIDAVRCVLPPGIHIKEERYLSLSIPVEETRRLMEELGSRAPKQGAILHYLMEVGGEATCDSIMEVTGAGMGSITALVDKGYGRILHRWTDPSVKPKQIQVFELHVSIDEAMAWFGENHRRAPKQAAIVDVLVSESRKGEVFTAAMLADLAETSPSTVYALEAKGLLRRRLVEVYRDPYRAITSMKRPLTPNLDQAKALKELEVALEKGRHQVYLLRGVTGSGKTEVYLQAIGNALQLGKRAIVLVPEISLTPQTVKRFKDRFGEGVAILHSRLSMGERFDEWRRIRSGEADIVVGARSAIFAPLMNLGLIVIDEEHDQSYKQDEMPCYHTRDVAIWRAKEHKALVILGSATPDIESAYRASVGKYQLLQLPHRVENRPLPQVRIVDMREELKGGNRTILSRDLRAAIQKRLEQGEQMMILLNRRGYATCVLCRGCGLVMECTNCRVSLTYHEPDASVVCHYCGLTMPLPKLCPQCRSRYLHRFGVGTQRVEEVLKQEFSGARLLRMDFDTTRRKGAHASILSRFRRGEADILLGTQMIAKGHDFPGVTLVGVITADTALNIPDFRGGERTFQLLTQVGGRAGRGDKEGEVIIQTYTPEHYSIQAAARQDYVAFYHEELAFRRDLGYPPFSFLARLLITGPVEKDVIDTAHQVTQEVELVTHTQGLQTEFTTLGPSPAPLSLVRSRYRWHVLLKGSESAIREVLDGLVEVLPTGSDCSVSVDVAPSSLL